MICGEEQGKITHCFIWVYWCLCEVCFHGTNNAAAMKCSRLPVRRINLFLGLWVRIRIKCNVLLGIQNEKTENK